MDRLQSVEVLLKVRFTFNTLSSNESFIKGYVWRRFASFQAFYIRHLLGNYLHQLILMCLFLVLVLRPTGVKLLFLFFKLSFRSLFVKFCISWNSLTKLRTQPMKMQICYRFKARVITNQTLSGHTFHKNPLRLFTLDCIY